MQRGSHNLELKAILIPDKKLGGYTTYFEQFPEVIAEGATEDEAIENLKNALFFMLRDLFKTPSHNVTDCDDNDTEYTSRTINVFA